MLCAFGHVVGLNGVLEITFMSYEPSTVKHISALQISCKLTLDEEFVEENVESTSEDRRNTKWTMLHRKTKLKKIKENEVTSVKEVN